MIHTITLIDTTTTAATVTPISNQEISRSSIFNCDCGNIRTKRKKGATKRDADEEELLGYIITERSTKLIQIAIAHCTLETNPEKNY